VPTLINWSKTVGLNREEKASVVTEFGAVLAESAVVVVAEYRGLGVGAMTELRRKARESGIHLRVLKNTLARRAMAGTPCASLADRLVGPLIYGASRDPVAAAKVLNDFAKTNDKLIIKAGALGASILDADGVKALATMPSREELLAKLLGTMQAPIATFVRTLNEVPGRFVRTLDAVRDQKEKASA